MANLLSNPVYITAQDIDDTSKDADLIALSVADKEQLITQAQYIIDDYIECYGIKFDGSQEFIFPTQDSDGNVEPIPNDIKVATLYLVEDLFSSGTGGGSASTRVIKSEKVLTHTVTYEDSETSGFSARLINDKTKSILDKYRLTFIGQSLC